MQIGDIQMEILMAQQTLLNRLLGNRREVGITVQLKFTTPNKAKTSTTV